ncbi:MAG: hypothetical protein MUF38_01905 [Anaerolineae bacterium]|nr:hypothetical protein [Anaerolineae bacterium]
MSDDQAFHTNLMDGMNLFQNARGRAFWQEMFALLRGKSPDLLSFDDIRERLRLHEELYRGLQDIPVDKIRGSVGRYRDFTSTFLPRKNEMQERWSRVYAVANSMLGLPPIDVYQVGDVYFVRDGNHRVSVAKQIGSKTIQAHVTEISTPVPFYVGMTDQDIDAAGAYADFLDQTGLKQTRMHHQSLRLSDPSRYPDMLGLIRVHRSILMEARGEGVSLEQAAADWYDHVYRPAVTAIRKYKAMDAHPDRTEADLFLWLVGNLRDLRVAFDEFDDDDNREVLVSYLRSHGMEVPDDFLADDHNPAELSIEYMERAIVVAQQQVNGDPDDGGR